MPKRQRGGQRLAPCAGWRLLDITHAAKPGQNRLEILVTNLWPNRLIGDQFLAEEQRFTKTNITKFKRESALMPSGLLGPVVIRRIAHAPVPER